MKLIAKALLQAQKEMGNAVKDSKNPFFKSTYADLNSIREACMPALNNNGIVVLQPTTFIEGKNFIKTVLLHESGETIEALTEIVYSKQNDAQSQGSGITYARRYGLQSLVNVGAEDDDGNSASTKDVKVSVNVDDYINKLNACTTKDALRAVYLSMPKAIQTQLVEYVKTLSESKA
jgi:Tfp pilus assembly protein PilZ